MRPATPGPVLLGRESAIRKHVRRGGSLRRLLALAPPKSIVFKRVLLVKAIVSQFLAKWPCVFQSGGVSQKDKKGLLEGSSPKGRALTNKCEKKPWECQNRFPLTCANHGEIISVPCGRWKSCVACRIRKTWEIKARFLAGMESVPPGKSAKFVTLTFPRDQAPTEDEAHQALRSLVSRLRYRDYLGSYGWVLQRQGNGAGNDLAKHPSGEEPGTLHYHGVFHLPWFDDELVEWRSLVKASGFGEQQNIKAAKPKHAGYIASYISSRLARLSPVRRAFSFSQDFPRSDFDIEKRSKKEQKVLLKQLGVEASCDWLPSGIVDSWLR